MTVDSGFANHIYEHSARIARDPDKKFSAPEVLSRNGSIASEFTSRIRPRTAKRRRVPHPVMPRQGHIDIPKVKLRVINSSAC